MNNLYHTLNKIAREILDDRSNKKKPFGYVIMIDNFMSGWGKAPGKSYYAIAVDDDKERDTVIENAENRSEMSNVRFRTYLPKIGEQDHLHVTDKEHASRWFTKGGFSK